MKSKIKGILKSDLFKVVALVLSVILGGWLIMYPETVTDKTVVLLGVLISISEIRQFMKWITEDDFKREIDISFDLNEVEVKEPEVVNNEDTYDGGDDFSKFKAENGITD